MSVAASSVAFPLVPDQESRMRREKENEVKQELTDSTIMRIEEDLMERVFPEPQAPTPLWPEVSPRIEEEGK
jgi:hypothetical protein